MYCTRCGKPMADGSKFCTECGAPVAGGGGGAPAPESAGPETWDAFFQSLASELLQVTRVSPERFEFAGERKIKALLSRTTVRYQAVALLDPSAMTIQWWEKLSESSLGIAPENFGVSAETRKQKGTVVEIRKTVQTVGGGYAYHYGDLRAVVEREVARRGWTFQLLVARPKG